jgi:hypothetical protein
VPLNAFCCEASCMLPCLVWLRLPALHATATRLLRLSQITLTETNASMQELALDKQEPFRSVDCARQAGSRRCAACDVTPPLCGK